MAFERVVLDSNVGIGYGVAIADVDGDGHRDVLLVDQHEVRWYRAPKWEARALCGRLSELDHVCLAACDVTGDAKAEIAIGAGWNPGDTKTEAPCFLLEPAEDPLAPRVVSAPLPLDPTLHRMKWIVNRRGEGRLIALPLHGRSDEYRPGAGVRLLELRPPRDGAGWVVMPFQTSLHQAHNFDVVEWDGDADAELIVGASEGLFLFDRRHRGADGGSRWLSTELVGATTGHPDTTGASEVRLGRFANGRRFLAAIEPFHGNALVAYVEPAQDLGAWTRVVLDEGLAEGHALACGDLFGRGDDSIVVGWRKPDAKGRTGIAVFTPSSLPATSLTAMPRFERSVLDESIACEDLALGDLDEDGRLDVVASGRDSHDLVLFLNREPRRSPPPEMEGRAARVPLDVRWLDEVERELAQACGNGELLGCVVAIGRSDGIHWMRPRGMELDTVFDLASLTKPIATATSIAILASEGRLALDDPLSKHLPEFAGDATLRQCLLHTAGFVPDNDLADYEQGIDESWRRLFAQQPASEPGSAFVYSDVGYELLGKVVERVSGKSLADFARERIFAPLSMAETGFLPGDALKARAAPTEERDGVMLQGVVHDPRAALLGGIAGHAGLFATVFDLSRYARMLLNGGELDGARALTPEALALLTTAEPLPGGTLRTPGFDVRSRFSSNRGELMTSRAFGHGGFTGTGIWIDPGLDLFVIFLSSRLHGAPPDKPRVVNPLIGRIGTIASAAIGRPRPATPDERTADATGMPASDPVEPQPPRAFVKCGIDVLRERDFDGIRNMRVGLVTNATGRARDGTSTIALLASPEARAAGVELAAIFTPEHGLDGLADAAVKDGVETTTGVPVFSLYGERTAPTPEQLAGLQALVFDVQDAGARCYTYVATMKLCMEAAAAGSTPLFVVLDRPDPIGGELVDGPLPDGGRTSFTCPHAIPFQHGMTVGELAQMFVAEGGRGRFGDRPVVEVVTMEGWRRADRFDATGLPWVNPSPNLRSLDAELLYPGLVLFESTNLSVGRGTDTPFEQLGAPWIDAAALAGEFAARPLPGCTLAPIDFTPTSSKFANELCHGLRVTITDRAALRPMQVGLEIAAALVRRHAKEFELDKMDALLCSKSTIAALRAGLPTAAILADWQRGADAFRERRAPFLLYR